MVYYGKGSYYYKLLKRELEKIDFSVCDKLQKYIMKINKKEDGDDDDEYDTDDGYDFEIICPYCNTQFIADIESKTEIKCPECQNVIELDWNNEESQGCSGHCSMCNSRCNNSFFDEFGEEINFFDDKGWKQ